MRYLAPLISDARGKLGGTVYSRNPYGPYTRAKTAPIQPRTPSQQAGRANFASATGTWRALTVTDRAAWSAYADTLTRRGSLGHAYTPSGFHTFLTAFRFAQQAGAAVAPSPPPLGSTLLLPAFGAAATISSLTGAFVLAITPAAPFTLSPGTYIPYATPGLSSSISFVPRQTYRNLVPAFTPDPVLAYYHAEAQYLAVFPAPSVGSLLHIQIRSANRFTGLVSRPALRTVTVTAVP
jgi:hypothetical protein